MQNPDPSSQSENEIGWKPEEFKNDIPLIQSIITGRSPPKRETTADDQDAAEIESDNVSRVDEDFKKKLQENFELLRKDVDLNDIEFVSPERVREVRDNLISNSVLIAKPNIYEFHSTLGNLKHEVAILDLKEDEKDRIVHSLEKLITMTTKITEEKVTDSVTLAVKFRQIFAAATSKFTESSNHKIKVLSDELGVLTKQRDQLAEDLEAATRQLNEVERKLAVITSDRDRVEKEYHEFRKSTRDFEKDSIALKAENEILSRNLSDKEAQIDALSKENMRQSSEIKDLNHKLSMARDAEAILKQNQELKNENQKLMERHSLLEGEYKKMLQGNENQMKEVKEKLNFIPVLQGELQHKNQELTRENEKLKTELQENKKKCTEEIEKLNLEIRKMKEEHMKLQSFQQENIKLNKSLEIAAEERKRLEDQITRLQEDIEDKLKHIGTIETKMNTSRSEKSPGLLQGEEDQRIKKEHELNLKKLDELRKKQSQDEALAIEKETEIRKLKQDKEKLQEALGKATEKVNQLQAELEKVKKLQGVDGDGKGSPEREQILEGYRNEIIKLTRSLQAEKQRIEHLWQELEKQKIENGEAKRQIEEKNYQLEQSLRNQVSRVGNGRSRGTAEKGHPGRIKDAMAIVFAVLLTSLFWMFIHGRVPNYFRW